MSESATAPSAAEHAAGMSVYSEEGLALAAAIGNRGPVRFNSDGTLHQDILDAYWERLSNVSSVIWSSFVKMLVIKSQIALIRSLPVIRNLHHQCRHQAW